MIKSPAKRTKVFNNLFKFGQVVNLVWPEKKKNVNVGSFMYLTFSDRQKNSYKSCKTKGGPLIQDIWMNNLITKEKKFGVTIPKLFFSSFSGMRQITDDNHICIWKPQLILISCASVEV